ncbi:hypothetical protein TSUD_98990 [Trifolium subterraneum]|uniref:SKP1 component dimerisation domain-containing protein n=1 Tax=Trifolium subterraneum TaxID=3900 RepID=A0A2Z6PCR9_TRISU|nr:hypothetical protein TSUD_98990 [Trifolium subterraneum]
MAEESSQASSSSKMITLKSSDEGKHLAIVIEFIKKNKKEYDAEFGTERSIVDMMVLLLAANYLNVSSFSECLCQALAKRIENKSPEFVFKVFNVENDYSPEEEVELRKEVAWAFEGIDRD